MGQAGVAVRGAALSGGDLVGDVDGDPTPDSLTEPARAEVCRRVGQDGHSVAQVAAEFGVAWRTVMDAVPGSARRAVMSIAACRELPPMSVKKSSSIDGGSERK